MRHCQPGQPRKQPPGTRVLCTGLAIFKVPIEFLCVEVGTPDTPLARAAHQDLVQGPPLNRQRLGAYRQHMGQIVLDCSRLSVPRSHRRALTGGRAQQQRFPGVDIDFAHLDVGGHAALGQRRRFLARQPERNGPAQHPRLWRAQVAHILDRAHPLDVQRQLIVQRRWSGRHGHGRQSLARELVLEPHGHAALGRFPHGRRQRQRQALQTAADLQLRHSPAQSQRERIRRAARGLFRQLGQQAQLPGLAQAFGRSHPLGAQLQHRFGRRCARGQRTHAAFEPHVPPQRTGLHTHQ